MAERAKILIIYTGGTIGMKNDEATGALVPFDFSSIYEEFPSLRRLNVALDVHTFESVIDSSNVTPHFWCCLAELIGERYQMYDGFVVLHGTDTMSYTASALSFMLEDLAKPVVFTGSQIPIGVLRTDGRENLITAIEIAAAYDEQGRARVPEVSLYFQNKLFRANRTTKWSAEELNAFHSPNFPPLAEVGVNITYNSQVVRRAERGGGELTISTNISDGVAIIKLFPGLSSHMLGQMLSCEGLRGVVLQTYGAGNAPTSEPFISTIESAVARGVVMLNISQCVNGRVEMSLYQTGLGLSKAGVVCGSDMTIEAATTKMCYLLGKYERLEDVKKAIKSNLSGELSE
ncbi:MAG: type I asparaginase [Rikenellaceae bacterium]